MQYMYTHLKCATTHCIHVQYILVYSSVRLLLLTLYQVRNMGTRWYRLCSKIIVKNAKIYTSAEKYRVEFRSREVDIIPLGVVAGSMPTIWSNYRQTLYYLNHDNSWWKWQTVACLPSLCWHKVELEGGWVGRWLSWKKYLETVGKGVSNKPF